MTSDARLSAGCSADREVREMPGNEIVSWKSGNRHRNQEIFRKCQGKLTICRWAWKNFKESGRLNMELRRFSYTMLSPLSKRCAEVVWLLMPHLGTLGLPKSYNWSTCHRNRLFVRDCQEMSRNLIMPYRWAPCTGLIGVRYKKQNFLAS